MNFTAKIKNILGTFWTSVFKNVLLIDGLSNAHALLLKRSDSLEALWESRISPDKTVMYEDRFPFQMYFTRIGRGINEDGSIKIIAEHEGMPLESVLDGTASLDDENPNAGFVSSSLFRTPEPWYLTDHIVDYTITLFNGVDFEYKNGHFIFYRNPEDLGVAVCHMPDADGRIRECYKLFGWSAPSVAVKEYADIFETNALSEYGDLVWRMHQEGATVYNSKMLLAAVTGMTVAENDGKVTGLWFEQGFIHIKVGDRLYSVRVSDEIAEAVYNDMSNSGDALSSYVIPDTYLESSDINVRKNDQVRAGDILKGGLRVVCGDNLVAKPKWICEDTATVLNIQDDGVTRFIDAGNVIYNAPVSWSTSIGIGSSIRFGQEVFTPDDSFTTTDWVDESEVDGISVSTPVGTLFARNRMVRCRKVAWNENGDTVNVIPLEGDASAAYDSLCADRYRKGIVDSVKVPDYINPMVFITSQIRGATSTLIYIRAKKTPKLEAALDCIKRNSIASSLLDVHIAENTL